MGRRRTASSVKDGQYSTLFPVAAATVASTLPTIRKIAPAAQPVDADEEEDRTSPYERLYAALRGLREQFHRIGRFDDANTKLDELCKLLVLKVLDSRHPEVNGNSRLKLHSLRQRAQTLHGDPSRLASALHDVFDEMAKQYEAEIQGFGPNRKLNLQTDDDEFAAALIPLLDALPTTDVHDTARWSFDGLNEAFGHFIQDSFRNRKDDAQYMTPPEVTAALVDIALHDMAREFDPDQHGPLVVADPTCGVGSFLAAFYRHASHVSVGRRKLSEFVKLFGQDKVERMVRLTAVNLKVFAMADATVRQGNSIRPAGGLDDVAGKIDLILTNPPFGATFDAKDILADSTPRQYPVIYALSRAGKLPKMLDSEYLLLDREVALLKPGGRLLMVVPDHVVSGGGFSEQFRLVLRNYADLVAVLDLPTETFAQAGTRTKTSVVYLRRKGHNAAARRHIFMATSEDLGFTVVERTGVSVKKITGTCDLVPIVKAYREAATMDESDESIICLCQSPSVAAVAENELLNNRWTAGFYRAERLEVLQQLRQLERRGFDLVPLHEVVDIDPCESEKVFADDRNQCISVLHVQDDGCIDLQGVADYKPTTACARCQTGDVLLSKINPRIPRLCVVPPSDKRFGCSAEFAVMRTRDERVTPWTLLLLLRSRLVQSQVKVLTSGTSSSHNRIKDKDLTAVIVPVPKKGGRVERRLAEQGAELEAAATRYYDARGLIQSAYQVINDLLR